MSNIEALKFLMSVECKNDEKMNEAIKLAILALAEKVRNGE